MADFETVKDIEEVGVEPEAPETNDMPESSEPSKGEKFLAGVKEWFRKFTVKLKHKTHMIPLVILLITSVIYLCILNSLSKVISVASGIDSAGICIFVNTLASILVLLVFLNTFPKRKKVNIVMLVITFVVMALILALDFVFYFKLYNYCMKAYRGVGQVNLTTKYNMIHSALNNTIVHVVFMAFSILALAFLPLYKKGINKINTKQGLAENDIKEEIATSAEA